MLEARELEEYGKVEICKELELENKFHVKITNYENKALKTFRLMAKIEEAVGRKYSIIDYLVTDEGIFEYILKAE